MEIPWYEDNLTYEFIRGLVVGEGCFTFSGTTRKFADGTVLKTKIPAFAIVMHERDQWLLRQVRHKLGVQNSVYVYENNGKDGSKRGRKAVLIIRELDSLKDVIIPLFYRGLSGHKAIQFKEWLEKIGADPMVPYKFKLIHKLHKDGFYKNEVVPGGRFSRFLVAENKELVSRF